MEKTIHGLHTFFKHEISYHAKKKRELESQNPRASKNHEDTLEWFTLASTFVAEQIEKNKNNKQASTETDDLFSINPLDLGDFPEEFIGELSLTESDTQEAQILDILAIAGRPINLNELLVALLRKHETQYKRTALTAKLYRLMKSGQVESPNKGVYQLGKAEELELDPALERELDREDLLEELKEIS